MKNILLLSLVLFFGTSMAQDACPVEFTVTNPGSPCSGTPISLTANGPSDVVFFVSWDFSDGGSATGKSVSHTFTTNPPQGSIYATATITVLDPSSLFLKNFTCTRDLYSTTPCIIIDIPEVPPVPPGNPFVKGEEGNFRIKRSWVYQVERSLTRNGSDDNLNLREDGIYKRFHSFWNPTSSSGNFWFKQDEDKWTFKTQINHYNPYGSFELENVDPLSRYSSAVYGYNYTIPVAVAANARYREIAFDSFEDYDFGRCANNHFSFQFVDGIENKIKETTSHSGRRSIRLGPGETVIVQKQFAECEEEEKPVVVK